MAGPPSDDGLRDKVALVTGAGGLLGGASAAAIAAAGGRVLVSDLAPDRLEETAERIRSTYGPETVVAETADLADDDAPARIVRAAVEAFGALHTVVHAAVDSGRGLIEDLTAAQWARADAVNTRAAVWLTREALPHFGRSGGGSVVLFSSVQAEYGHGGATLYGATKGAVESLTRHLAVELGARGVRVNAIRPGYVPHLEHPDGTARPYPLGRLGRPDEIAALVTFLASDASAWTSGAVITVDGGLSALHPGFAAPPAPAPPTTAQRWRARVRRYAGRSRS